MEGPSAVDQLVTSSGEHISLDDIARVSKGFLEGAAFAIAMPRNMPWNHCLLIHAHGFRPEGTPPIAEIDDHFWWRLVQQGWAVAVTSYRRSGLIVADAIRDINNLRNHISNEFDYPYWCFLDGRSMGGAISVRVAERKNVCRVFNGVMATGAALMVVPDDPSLKFTYRPTIPILFLTNTSETGPVEAYIEKVKKEAEKDARARAGGDEVMVPALHAVQREGHNWTNARERWRGFSTLVEWAFVGSLVTEFRSDATSAGTATPGHLSRVEVDGKPALKGRVRDVQDISSFGTSFTLSDLAAVHIRFNSTFTLRTHGGTEVQCWLGAYPFVGIPDNAIAASEDPEGWIVIFEMSEFRNKPATQVLSLGLRVNDDIYVMLPPAPSPRSFKRLHMPAPIDL